MKASMDPKVPTADRYLAFAEVEARGMSACYEAWAEGVASDPATLDLINRLPAAKRQPNLVFSAARFNGAAAGPYAEFAAWLAEHWDAVEATCLSHATQTNEAGRCATLLPALAGFSGPLALIEVGASAGLCLTPDKYSYRYRSQDGTVCMLDPADGPSRVVLDCTVAGPVPIPERMPNVIWRAGIDLNPLDLASEADVAWLDALIWPEHTDRRDRLREAVAVAGAEEFTLVRGDLNDEIEALVARAPREATVVVFHTVVLGYVDAPERQRFADTMARLPARWLSNEAVDVVPDVADRLQVERDDSTEFVLALDGEPLAFTQPHGRSVHWIQG